MFLFLPKKAIISWVATITWKKKISGPAAIACGLFAILIDVTRCFWVSLMFLSRLTETIEGDEEHTLKSGFKFSKKRQGITIWIKPNICTTNTSYLSLGLPRRKTVLFRMCMFTGSKVLWRTYSTKRTKTTGQGAVPESKTKTTPLSPSEA